MIEKYPHLEGMTREEAWKLEINERNKWIASVRNWIVPAKESVMQERLATDSDVLQSLEDSMTRIIDSLLDFENRPSIADFCMEEDRLNRSRRANLRLPEFQPLTASPKLTPSTAGSFPAPSNTQTVAGSGSSVTGTGADTVRESSVAAENLIDKLVRVLSENLPGIKAAELHHALAGMQTTGGLGISASVGREESSSTTRGGPISTNTSTGTTLSEAIQQPRDSNHGGDGDKTPRAQTPSDALRNRIGSSEDDLERSQWLSNDSASSQRTQGSRSTSTTASRNVNEPPRQDTPTGNTTRTPNDLDSNDNKKDSNDSKPYVGYYQAEPPYKLAPKRGTSASSSCNTPTQPPRQPQGSGTADKTKTTDHSSPGEFGGGRQAQGSLQGQGSVRGRGGVNYYNRAALGETVRVAHPDRPSEPFHFSRTGQQNPGQQQQQQQAGSSRWTSTNARNDEDQMASQSGSQASTARQEPRGQGQGQGQGQAQGENQSQGRTQKQSDWEEYKPKDGTTLRNDW